MNYSTSFNGDVFGTATGVIAILLLVLWVLVHLALSVGVTTDIKIIRVNGREPRFMSSLGWGFVTLMTGPVGFALYWVTHHSTLRDPKSDLSGPTQTSR